MKRCADCGSGFVGLGERCAPCERHSRHVKKPETPVTPGTVKEPKPVTQRHSRETGVTRSETGVTQRDRLEAERLALLERLAEINRQLGPMTGAERQRRWRARRRIPAQPG